MYSSQQLTYSKNSNNYITKATLNNELFFIGNQKLVSIIPNIHQQQQLQLSPSTSILMDSILLPVMGHTTHKIDNDLVSFFGKPEQPPVTTIHINRSPSSSSISSISLQQLTQPSPSRRYAHTTTMVQSNDSNNTTIFLIGGSSIQDDMPLFDIWKLEWDTKKWIHLDVQQTDASVPGLMGHVTLVLPRHPHHPLLLTCFGATTTTNHRQPFAIFDSTDCALFNTHTLAWKPVNYTSTTSTTTIHKNTPPPRIYASMIPTNDTHAVLYGGQSLASATLLDDLWWLHLDDLDTKGTVTFTRLGHFLPRAGHTASMISENHMMVYGGQSSSLPELDSFAIDLETHHDDIRIFSGGSSHSLYQKRQLALESPSSVTQAGLGGGAIGGIIVAILLVLGISITVFIFYQRRKRRQRNYNLSSSQGSRFSLATPSPQRSAQPSTVILQQPSPAKTRISHMSFGSEFGVGLGSRSSMSKKRTSSTWGTISTVSLHSNRNSNSNSKRSSSSNNTTNPPHLLDSPSRQLYTNWICETSPTLPSCKNNDGSNDSNTRSMIDPRHTSMSISQHTSSLDNNHTNEYYMGKKVESSGTSGSGKTLDRLRLSIFKPLDIIPSITESSPTKNDTSSPEQSTPNSHMTTTTTTISPMPDQSPSTSKQRSSMFGLSKFLHLGDSSTTTTSRVQQYQQDMTKKQQQQQQQRQSQLNPRESLGSKSVASLQWVEFNSEMDFNGGNHWPTQRHLMVMNHRQSSATISSASGISSSMDDLHARAPPLPASPRDIVAMAQQLQQQHRQQQQQHQQQGSYQLSERELQSWEESRLSRLVPPSPRKFNTTTTTTTTSSSSSSSPSLT